MHHLHLFSICITTLIQRTISHYVDVDLWIPAIRRSSTCIGDYTFDKSPNAKNWGEASINEFMQLGYYEGYGLGWPGRELNRIERSPVPYGCWFEPRTAYPQNYVQFVNIGSNPLISHDAAIYTALQLTNRGHCLEREGIGCVDKYWCYQALKLGYTGIVRHLVYSIEMVVCTGGCGTVKFNGSCPPTELRQGYRASELCDCGGASNKSVIDCPSKGKDYVTCNGGNVNILKTPPLTKLSISTDKCILEDLTMMSNAIENHDLNLTIVLASNMIMGFFRSNHKIHHYTNSWVEALEQEHSNVSVILDFEQHANLQMYGYDRADRLSHPSHRSISIVDEVLLKQNRLQIVGLNSFYRKHNEYSIQFDDFFNLVDDIANRKGPKRTRKSNHTKLYTNIEGFRYASSFRVRDIMIGVITVENRLLKESIFDWHDLIEWIEKETKCLHKLGAKIVLLLTDLVRISALKVMRAIPFGIDLILSVHDDGEDDDYELCNLHCDYRNVQDRIVIIKPSNHQSEDFTAAFIKIHAFNLTASNRLSYTAALVVQNISLFGSHQ